MKKRVEEWLLFAEEDLKSAKLLIEESIYTQTCFHSQQCAEKSLKALIEKKIKVPKEHSLLKLLKVCRELHYSLEAYREDLEFLDKFYTFTRYPFLVGILPTGKPTKEDAAKALEVAENIYFLAKKLLG